MLKAVYIVKNKENIHSDAVAAEMLRAVKSLRKAGFQSALLAADTAAEAALGAKAAASAGAGIFCGNAGDKAGTGNLSGTADLSGTGDLSGTAAEAEILFLCESGSVLEELIRRGCFAIGYAHGDNPGERFPGAPYIVQEPDLVDADSYVKMYQRAAGLPWSILETRRFLVREFTPEDLDGIYALYDEQARRFLEPPSPDRAHELEVLRAYIDRIYGLYGFGHWAVLPKEQPGTLIGRVGYAAVTTLQEEEAKCFGLPIPDADFGFLIGAGWRRQGAAQEICGALLRYGFSELGFTCIRADARSDNAASVRLLTKLGFVPAGNCLSAEGREEADKTVFYLR